jgi:hypothetical protein
MSDLSLFAIEKDLFEFIIWKILMFFQLLTRTKLLASSVRVELDTKLGVFS